MSAPRSLRSLRSPVVVLAVVLAGLVLPAQVATAAAPASPAAPLVTSDGQSLDVSWTTPDDNGSPVTRYDVRVLDGGDEVVAAHQVDAATTSHRFSGLDDGAYTATVTALGSDGASAASPESAAASVDLDLLASWTFEGLTATSDGTAVPDTSGNRHAATIRGNGATLAGDVLTLPGGGSTSGAAHVQLPTGLFDGRDTLTISTWLKNGTGSGNYAAMFFGTTQNPPSRYWLLNPKNPAGRFKSVITDGPVTTAPWGTERGFSPTTASRGMLGPVTSAEWGLYTTVIQPGQITGYYNGAKIGTVAHTTPISTFGSNLVAYIGRSSYPDQLYKGGVRDVRVYTSALTDATVAAQYDYDKAVADAAALDLPAETATDLDLLTTGARGSQVSWSSSNPAVLASTGLVTRPQGADVVVTLTALVGQGGKSVTRTFDVTVLGEDPAADVARVSAAYDVAISAVVDDIVLKTEVDGVAIAWESSAPGVVAADGQVTRPAEHTPVTLTATFSRAGHTATREFQVAVLPEDAGRIGTYIRSGDTNRTDAVHLAHAEGAGTSFTALNNNRPVRYADSGTVKLGAPTVFRKPDGTFGLAATVNSASSTIHVYDSADLITFEDQRVVSFNGLGLTAASVRVAYDNGIAAYRLTFVALGDGKTYQVRTTDFAEFSTPVEVAPLAPDAPATFPSGALEASSIGVTAAEQAAVLRKYTRMSSTGTRPIDPVTVPQGGDLDLPEAATVTYSNGGSDTQLPVDWNADDVAAVDTDVPGEYVVHGDVVRPAYPQKLAHQRADPDVTLGDDGAYYLTGSYPQVGNDPEGYDRIVLRRAQTIQGLADAQEVVLWDEASSALQRYVWAPELVKIHGDWYILFTASRSGNVFDIRPMMLRHTGGDLMDPANWVEVGAMLPQAGDRAFNSFSLDMTYFEQGGRHYVIWAQASPSSALLMAEIDPANPRQLISPAVTIAYPELAWEGNTATNQYIDEGAAVIKRGGKLYVTFSAATVDDKYAVGLLTADADAELLDPSSWRKTSYPLLATADLPAGENGPGHNSFTVDPLGNPVIVYHSRTVADMTDGGLTDPSRHARARTVHFDGDGDPVLNMTAEEELAEAHRAVEVTVVVEESPVAAPGAPGGPTVTQRTSSGALVSWTAPAEDGGAAVSRYRVRVTQDGTDVSDQEVAGTSLSLTGLTAGTTYAVTVAAGNSAGYGPASADVEFTTETLPEPVIHYPLADDLSPTIGDGDATAIGPVTLDGALTLPGGANSSTGYVALPDDLLVGRGDNLTISVWVNSDTAPRNGAALAFGTPPVNGLPSNYWLLNPTGPNGNARSVMTNGVNATQPWTTEVQVAGPNTTRRRGSWVNYTTVFTPTSLTAYVGGVKIGTVAKGRRFADYAAAGTLKGYLGRSGYTGDAAFKGSFRNLSVFGSSLSDAQVAGVAGDDGFVLEMARDRLSLGDTSAVSSDLDLPLSLGDGVTVSWQTSDPSVVTASGDVTVAETSRTATLTAILTRGAATLTTSFEVTVVAVGDLVTDLAETLVLPPSLASGDDLPTSDVAGVNIAWSTDSPGLAVVDGAVTASEPVTGDLVATVTADGTAEVVKTLEVRVLPAADARFVLGYTRTPLETQVYGPNVAHSLHLAAGADRGALPALNDNIGVMYARGVEVGLEQHAIRTLRDPFVLGTAGGGHAVLATRTLSGGAPDDSADDSLLLLTSPDLVDFTEVGMVEVDPEGRGVRAPRAWWDSAAERYVVAWRTADGTQMVALADDLADASTYSTPRRGSVTTVSPKAATIATGAVPGNALVVDAETAGALRDRYGRIHNTGSSVDHVEVAHGGTLDLDGLRAELTYDDGSTATRAVTWDADDLAAVDTSTPGTYEVHGTVRQTDHAFPFIAGRADPSIMRWQGRYLFMATVTSESEFLLRQADTIEGLRTATDHRILGEGGGLPGPLWAPEFHEVGGELYVFFAAGVDSRCWCAVQAHVMRLIGDDPTDPADWGAPQLVQERDGGRLQIADKPGISLDMTYFEDERGGETVSYVAWSQRYNSGGLGDARMWIATVDPSDPSRLTSAPVMVNAPEFGWDLNTGAVIEAPFVIRHDDTLHLTFSGSGIDRTYAIGQMTAPAGADLLDPSVWHKEPAPVLSSKPATGQWGPGHSMFAVDEDGNEVIVYHARNAANGNSRDSGVRRIHWGVNGRLVLDMTADEEVAPGNRAVSTVVKVLAGADTTAPRLAVTVDPQAPTGAAGWYVGPVSVSASATDPKVAGAETSGHVLVEQRIGAGAWTPYTRPVDVPQGVTALTFRATDAAGNVSPEISRTVRLDATAPTVSGATTPARPDGRNGWFIARSVQLVLAGQDAGSGVASTEYRLGTSPWQSWTGPVALPVGVTTVGYRVTDAAGNVSPVQDLTVRLDPDAPKLSLRVVKDRVPSVRVAARASDVVSGLALIRYRVDGGAWKTYRRRELVSRPGVHRVTVRAVDTAGNTVTKKLKVRVPRLR